MATNKEWSQLIAKAWLDEDFKKLLETDPAAALNQCGIMSDETMIEVPARPEDLSDEQLNAFLKGEGGDLTVNNCC